MKNSKSSSKVDKGLTIREYAKAKGLSTKTINTYIKQGLIKRNEHKKIDPIESDRNLNCFIDTLNPKSRAGRKREGEKNIATTFYESKAIEKEYHAKLAKLKYQEYIKELVKAKDVEVVAFATARKVRDNMLNIPERIVSEIMSYFHLNATQETINKARVLIKTEIEKALQELQAN